MFLRTISTQDDAKSFLDNLTADSIKTSKNISVLVDALIIKIDIMSKSDLASLNEDISFSRVLKERDRSGRSGGLYDIHRPPEMIKALETAEERYSKYTTKLSNVKAALESIKKTNTIAPEQKSILDVYKTEFQGVNGEPSRTTMMFDRIMKLASNPALISEKTVVAEESKSSLRM